MDESSPTDQNSSVITPPPSQSNSEQGSEQPQAPTSPPSTDTPQKPVVSRKPGGKKKVLLVLLLLLLIGGGAAAYLLLKSNNNPAPAATTVKKDISVLNVGILQDGGVPQYPLKYPYTNDSIYIALQMFEGLVGYKDQTKVVPLLADNWSNPNDTTWVFNLRQGVKFHSGRTMTAQDVKYSLDYAVAHQKDSSGSTSTFYITSPIKQVTVSGPYQVTVTTNSPDAVLLNQLSLIGIIDSKATLGDYNAGTGPYIVKAGTTPSDSSIDLAAFNNYWGGHVYTREVKITLDTDQDKLAADAANGKFDLSGYFNNSQLSKIGSKTYGVPDQGLNYIGINANKINSPLHTLAVRQAIASALDIPAILKAGGLQGQQASQLVPLILPGHNPAIKNTPYNPDKAKQLLAGVSNANTQLTFAYPSANSPQVTEMVKELNAVGFNIKPILVSDFGVFLDDITAGKYDLFTASDTSATVDGLDILTDLLKGFQTYGNPQVDSLLTKAGSTLDPATRIKDMQQIATIVSNEAGIIPLYTQTRTFALTKPYIIKADLPSLFTSAYFWQVYQK